MSVTKPDPDATHQAVALDGELTLEMLPVSGIPALWSVETTRAFDKVDPRRVAELLDAADAAAFFTRPGPPVEQELSTVVFRVHIRAGDRSRDLLIGGPNTDPGLERLARAARACLRDWKVLTMARLSDEEREAFLAALRATDDMDEDRWPD